MKRLAKKRFFSEGDKQTPRAIDVAAFSYTIYPILSSRSADELVDHITVVDDDARAFKHLVEFIFGNHDISIHK